MEESKIKTFITVNLKGGEVIRIDSSEEAEALLIERKFGQFMGFRDVDNTVTIFNTSEILTIVFVPNEQPTDATS